MPAADESTELDRRLAEVDALRRRVLNVIPHALRTPITTFRGLTEALAHATDEEIRNDIGPALRRLAAQAEHLLDDLLIAAGYTTALPTGADTATPVVPEVHQVWQELPSAAGATLEVTGDDAVAALAPPGSVHKMLVHLLDNAAKYGTSGEPTTVTVARDADAGRVAVAVVSRGADPTDAAILAEPFYRGEAAVMRSSGLGVGLSVAKALAVQAGGTMTVDAAPAGVFAVTLDLRAAP